MFKDAPASIQETLAKLAGKLSLKNAGEPLALLAFNDKASAAARAEAIKALTTLKDSHLGDVARRAIKDGNTQVRSEGLQALAVADPAAAVTAIAEVLEKGSKAEKQGALAALIPIQNPEAIALLSAQLDKLLAQQLPAEIQLDVIDAAIAHDNAELKNKLAQYEAALPASDPLAKWRVALAGGSVERGRKVFREKGSDAVPALPQVRDRGQRGRPRPHARRLAEESRIHPRIHRLPRQANRRGLRDRGADAQRRQRRRPARLAAHSDKELKIETMDAQGKPQGRDRGGIADQGPPARPFAHAAELDGLPVEVGVARPGRVSRLAEVSEFSAWGTRTLYRAELSGAVRQRVAPVGDGAPRRPRKGQTFFPRQRRQKRRSSGSSESASEHPGFRGKQRVPTVPASWPHPPSTRSRDAAGAGTVGMRVGGDGTPGWSLADSLDPGLLGF
ncbi:MAG: hypothetical protein WDN28_16870 [Chthoniobacter sp.]